MLGIEIPDSADAQNLTSGQYHLPLVRHARPVADRDEVRHGLAGLNRGLISRCAGLLDSRPRPEGVELRAFRAEISRR